MCIVKPTERVFVFVCSGRYRTCRSSWGFVIKLWYPPPFSLFFVRHSVPPPPSSPSTAITRTNEQTNNTSPTYEAPAPIASNVQPRYDDLMQRVSFKPPVPTRGSSLVCWTPYCAQHKLLALNIPPPCAGKAIKIYQHGYKHDNADDRCEEFRCPIKLFEDDEDTITRTNNNTSPICGTSSSHRF